MDAAMRAAGHVMAIAAGDHSAPDAAPETDLNDPRTISETAAHGVR
jgi:hypothetical protein